MAMSKSFEQVLQNINNFISLKKEDREIYASHFNSVCTEIISRLNADPVFNKLFKGQSLAGSYADRLKISKPNEYDLVLHMKLIELPRVKIAKNEKAGYININVAGVLEKIKTEKQNEDIYEFLKNVTDPNGNLLQNKISSWLELLITKIKLEITEKPIKQYDLKFSRNGPAHTIDVIFNQKHFSIDFVPAFKFDKTLWTAQRKYPNHARNTNWIAIAKPIPSKPGPNIGFRTSYVDTERELIVDKNNLKNTLKMLKKIRDNHDITNLKSYYIKTVFLWENDKQSTEFWRKPAGEVLMHMFGELVKCLTDNKLLFFWDKSENMLMHFAKETQRTAIRNEVTSIYNKLKKAIESNDVDKIYDIFLNKEEKAELKRRIPNSDSSSNSSFESISKPQHNLPRRLDSVNNQVQKIQDQCAALTLNSNIVVYREKAQKALNNIKTKLNSNDPFDAMNHISLIVKQYEAEMQSAQIKEDGSCILQ